MHNHSSAHSGNQKRKFATWIINQITSIEIHNIVTKSTLHCLYHNKSKKRKRKKKKTNIKTFQFSDKKKNIYIYIYIYDLFFRASQIPNPPTHVLQSCVPLLWTPGGRSLNHLNFQMKKQTWMNERMKFKNLRKQETYSKPGSVEIGLIEVGDDFLDQVCVLFSKKFLSNKMP